MYSITSYKCGILEILMLYIYICMIRIHNFVNKENNLFKCKFLIIFFKY